MAPGYIELHATLEYRTCVRSLSPVPSGRSTRDRLGGILGGRMPPARACGGQRQPASILFRAYMALTGTDCCSMVKRSSPDRFRALAECHYWRLSSAAIGFVFSVLCQQFGTRGSTNGVPFSGPEVCPLL